MKLTIFTPTYNRAKTLNRLYQSLLSQKTSDFEWLIVDDGSADNTESLVRSFIKENRINIIYHKKENGGKHRAFNHGVTMANGEYFLCVDSDDWLSDYAIENIELYIDACSCDIIAAYKLDEKGKMLSDNFPNNIKKATSLYQLNSECHCQGEFTLIFKTDYIKRHPFPEFESERFITESVIYDRMMSDVSLLPQVITICEYQEEGLSNNLNRIMKNNPAGYCLYFMQRIDMQRSLKNRIIMAGKYHCFCIFAKQQKSKYNGKHKFLVGIAKPIGIMFWLYYKFKRGF